MEFDARVALVSEDDGLCQNHQADRLDADRRYGCGSRDPEVATGAMVKAPRAIGEAIAGAARRDCGRLGEAPTA